MLCKFRLSDTVTWCVCVLGDDDHSKLRNTLVRAQLTFFCMCRENFQESILSHFQVYSRVSSTLVTMLYGTALN